MREWIRRVFMPVWRETMRKWQADDGPWLAAAMAYYAAFSALPLLLVAVAVMGILAQSSPQGQDVRMQLSYLIARSTSPELARQIEQILAGIETGASLGAPLGLLGLLFSVMGIFGALDNAFDRLWDVPAPPQAGVLATVRLVLRQRMSAFLMLLAMGLLLVLAFGGSLLLAAISQEFERLPGAGVGLRVVQVLASAGVTALVVAVIYKVLPKAYVHWQDALAGGLLTAAVWEVGKQVLSLVVIGRNYSAYGVVGAFIALMAWIYYASTVFFLGAEVVQALCAIRKQAAEPLVSPLPASMPVVRPQRASRLLYALGGAAVGAGSLLATFVAALFVALTRRRRRQS